MLQRICMLMVLLVLCMGLAPSLDAQDANVQVVVLGIAQDAGRPHVGCTRPCCQHAWRNPKLRRYATCLAIVDPESEQRWMVECTPDFAWQLKLLNDLAKPSAANRVGLDGILLTHAHIGHYAGLMLLGREAMGADSVPVYGMPRMRKFLSTNGPWSQLVELENITLRALAEKETVALNERLRVEPFSVPHRDEFSETVGFRIMGPERTLLFIPDIDKWDHWEARVEDHILNSDVALLDGTFFSGDELPHRDLSEIPHPLVVESLDRFKGLDLVERDKIYFIHLNHTNPAHDAHGAEAKRIEAAGLHVAHRGLTFEL